MAIFKLSPTHREISALTGTLSLYARIPDTKNAMAVEKIVGIEKLYCVLTKSI